MSVDLIAPNGAEFRNNWWEWRPLAIYCFRVAPEVCERSRHFRRWMTNDGGMTQDEADDLSLVLSEEIASGRIEQYDPYAPENLIPFGPNLSEQDVREHYLWSVKNVMAFASFLADCDGFEIT